MAATMNSIRTVEQLSIDTSSNQEKSWLAEWISQLMNFNLQTQVHDTLSNCQVVARLKAREHTPTESPSENIAKKWRKIHGANDWAGLLDPLHPSLRREIIKYGEFAQSTYDAFDFDSFSEYCGSCRYNRYRLLQKAGLDRHGYNVCKYIYAMSYMELPTWIEQTQLSETWSRDSNWMGYVAVSDDKETRRIGRRDIMVTWRGTVTPTEWYQDFQQTLVPVGLGEARVEQGFMCLYKSKSEKTRYNKSSASEQVMSEIKRQIQFYETLQEEVSVTITGHSLGGALALLNAYEVASEFPKVHVSVISFGAPRVGNDDFRDEICQKGIKVLRIVSKQDFVPQMPGLIFNEGLERFEYITGDLNFLYTHVGTELTVDLESSPFLKKKFNVVGFHSLETYLHLVDGYISSASTFRIKARRDVALVNKGCDMLLDELRVPPCWYQMANKGLERNNIGRWIQPKREPEDIPSPIGVIISSHVFERPEDHLGLLALLDSES